MAKQYQLMEFMAVLTSLRSGFKKIGTIPKSGFMREVERGDLFELTF
jgi:hypothetical protein